MANDDGRAGAGDSVWSCRFCGSAVEATPRGRNLALHDSCVADLFAQLYAPEPEGEQPESISSYVERLRTKTGPGRP